jgi:hypothetical protein
MSKEKKDKTKICQGTPHLILCEGADAYYFLIWFLDFFKQKDSTFNLFRVYDYGGITELNQYLHTITKADGFKNVVRSLCVIRDAETDADGACHSIKDSLKDCGFSVPDAPYSCTDDKGRVYPQISTGFILFPDCNEKPQNGTLEDLCLRILAKECSNNILADADGALEPYKKYLPQLHKNRLHTYFSLTKEFVSLKIGEAARAKAFRWDRPEIESLKFFLRQMAGK